jgi:hypothetical protein
MVSRINNSEFGFTISKKLPEIGYYFRDIDHHYLPNVSDERSAKPVRLYPDVMWPINGY